MMNDAVKFAQRQILTNAKLYLYNELDSSSRSASERNRILCAECTLIELKELIHSPSNLLTLEGLIINFMKSSELPIIYLKVLNRRGRLIEHDIKVNEIHSLQNVKFLKFDSAFDGLWNIFLMKDINLEKLYPVYLARSVIRRNLYKRLSSELKPSSPSPWDVLNKRAMMALASLNKFELRMRDPQNARQMQRFMIKYTQSGTKPPFTLRVLNEKGRRTANFITIRDLLYNTSRDIVTKITFQNAFVDLEEVFEQEGYNTNEWLGIVSMTLKLSIQDSLMQLSDCPQYSPPRS